MSEPEVALALLRFIANRDGVDLDSVRRPQPAQPNPKDAEYILETYSKCLMIVYSAQKIYG